MDKTSKILLISPPYYRFLGMCNRYYPLGVLALATHLRSQGYQNVCVYDADYNDGPASIDYAAIPDRAPQYLASFGSVGHPIWDEVVQQIAQFRPDVVGLSIWTSYAASAFHIAHLVKATLPGCLTVVGGPHADIRDAEILQQCPDIDFVVRGEGEIALEELIRAHPASAERLTGIGGLTYRAAGGDVVRAQSTSDAHSREFAWPDRSMLMHESSYSGEDMGLVMTSRGCPFSCAFCHDHNRLVVRRPVASVMSEIEHVRRRYRTLLFTIKDDSFTVSRKYVYEFCAALSSMKPKVYWECNTRVDLIDDDMLLTMKRAGCIFVKVGIESGSPRILEEMGKGFSLEQARKASRLLRKIGIHWTGYFLAGLPGETTDDIEKTAAFMQELLPDFACIGIYEPFPGTRLFERGVAAGLYKEQMSLADFFHTTPSQYYLAESGRRSDVLAPTEFTAMEVRVKALFHRYNRGVRPIFRMGYARRGLYWRQPQTLWADFKKLRMY